MPNVRTPPLDQGGRGIATKSYIIALDEHYYDPEVKRHASGLDAIAAPATVQCLDDLGELRLKEMDEAGIDLQVLSHTMPGLQKLDAETAVPLARRANDRLAEAVRAHPNRFAAFAALPTADPKAAADELERTVGSLGFKEAMANGLTNGVFLDDKRFWPIFEPAQALDVPLLHASGNPASCGHRGLLQGLRRETSGNLVRRLGIYRRDRDARYSRRVERRIRRLSAP